MLNKLISRIKADPYIFIPSLFLLVVGFFIFFSAALGVMARNELKFYSILQNQFLFGFCLGSIAFLIGNLIPINFVKRVSPFIYLAGIFLCLLVFVPGIGFEHGGAKRWIVFGGFTMQPSEVLKYASILLIGYFYSKYGNLRENFFSRLAPIVLLSAGIGIVLIEPDLGTSTIILTGILTVFYLQQSKIIDLAIIGSLIVIVFLVFYNFYPHAKERVNTFLAPDKNSEHQNYQVKQTRVSIGSGLLFGDGYGKSIQKYHFLPEPIGDSIFAVIGEEFGFAGSLLLILFIASLAFRLIFVSINMREPFGKAVLSGTGTILLVQTFLNAGSSSGAIPFTGVPLPLVSHGSTSIIITMAVLGLCSQISARKNYI